MRLGLTRKANANREGTELCPVYAAENIRRLIQMFTVNSSWISDGFHSSNCSVLIKQRVKWINRPVKWTKIHPDRPKSGIQNVRQMFRKKTSEKFRTPKMIWLVKTWNPIISSQIWTSVFCKKTQNKAERLNAHYEFRTPCGSYCRKNERLDENKGFPILED